MQQRFRAIEARQDELPRPVIAEQLERRIGNIRTSIISLIESSRDAGWPETTKSWLLNQFRMYQGYESPPEAITSGKLKGTIFVGYNFRDSIPLLTTYTIVDEQQEIKESRGFLFTNDALYMVDYIKDPNTQLYVHKDYDGLKLFEFVEELHRDARRIIQPPTQRTE